MDTKDLLNDSSIHHGRNLVCLMNRKGFKMEDLEKALQLSQKQVEELTEMKKEAGEWIRASSYICYSQDCLPAFPAHIRNNNPKKKESTANGWTACNTYINMASASTRWTWRSTRWETAIIPPQSFQPSVSPPWKRTALRKPPSMFWTRPNSVRVWTIIHLQLRTALPIYVISPLPNHLSIMPSSTWQAIRSWHTNSTSLLPSNAITQKGQSILPFGTWSRQVERTRYWRSRFRMYMPGRSTFSM